MWTRRRYQPFRWYAPGTRDFLARSLDKNGSDMQGTKTEWGPGKWRLRVYVGVDERGKPRQRSRQFKGSAREADKALRQFVTEVEEGRIREENPTIPLLFDRWLAHLSNMGKARPYTIKQYRYAIDSTINPAFGHHRVDKLTAHHLDQQYARWLQEGVSPSTVLKHHRILSAALRQAVKWEMVERAVSNLASPPSANEPDPRAMTNDEVRAVVRAAAADDPVLGTAVALAAITGARRGELCGLRWADYHEPTRTLTIARMVSVVDRKPIEQNTKTRLGRRLNVGEWGAEVLASRREFQEKLAVDAETHLVANPWILSRRADGGAPVFPSGISNAFRRVARKAGLPHHLHELRHWAATTAIVGGTDVRTVAGRLGHSNPALTLRTYAKFIEAADEKAAAMLSAALQPDGP